MGQSWSAAAAECPRVGGQGQRRRLDLRPAGLPRPQGRPIIRASGVHPRVERGECLDASDQFAQQRADLDHAAGVRSQTLVRRAGATSTTSHRDEAPHADRVGVRAAGMNTARPWRIHPRPHCGSTVDRAWLCCEEQLVGRMLDEVKTTCGVLRARATKDEERLLLGRCACPSA